MNAPLTVRPARPADHLPMLDLWERSVRATHTFLTPDDIVTLRPQVAEEFAGDGVAWWVLADETDHPIGFLGYTPDTVEALFIDAGQQGRGGGKLLIAQAERLAEGPLKVDVNEQNPAARGFYESLGFEVIGRSATDGAGRPFPLLHMKRPR